MKLYIHIWHGILLRNIWFDMAIQNSISIYVNVFHQEVCMA